MKILLTEKYDPPIISILQGSMWKNKYGDIHRANDKPAVIFNNGDIVFYKDGKIHRDNDKPAIIRKKSKIILNNPAIASPQFEYYKNGARHRDNDKPAVIYFDDKKIWFEKGIIQRKSGGPAHVTSQIKEWFVEGIKIKTEYNYGNKTFNFIMHHQIKFKLIIFAFLNLISYILHKTL